VAKVLGVVLAIPGGVCTKVSSPNRKEPRIAMEALRRNGSVYRDHVNCSRMAKAASRPRILASCNSPDRSSRGCAEK
jgi:hypothetical protein